MLTLEVRSIRPLCAHVGLYMGQELLRYSTAVKARGHEHHVYVPIRVYIRESRWFPSTVAT